MSDPTLQSETPPLVPAPPEPEPAGQAGTPTMTVPPAPVRPGTSRLGSTAWVNVALAIALAVAIGGIGFAAGRMTAPASAAGAGGNGRTFTGGQFPGGGYFFGGNGGADGNGGPGGGLRGVFATGGASIQGTVESISGDTLTLKLASGETVQIALSGTTTYHSQAAASSGDVKTGGTVIVQLQLGRGAGQGNGATTPAATDVTVVP
jgi:hypothetical protein